MERESKETRRRRKEKVARDGDLISYIDDGGGEHINKQSGEFNRVGFYEVEECIFDVGFVFLYKEGDVSDEGLVLIGCRRVYGWEVDETEISR